MTGQYSFESGFATIHRVNHCADGRGGNTLTIFSKDEFREKNMLTASTHCLTHHDVDAFNQRRIKSENNILHSVKNSEAMIQQSIECGGATSRELNRQREQLKKTECHLGEMTKDLQTTDRNIKGMSRVFSSVSNYFTNRLPKPKISRSRWSPGSDHGIKVKVQDEDDNEVCEMEKTKVNRIECISYRKKSLIELDNFEDVIDSQLDGINNSLQKLKGLAIGLGNELDSQNDLLDKLNNKAEEAEIKLRKQNKCIDKLLK